MFRLWTPGEKITFTAQQKIKSQSQIYSYGGSIFCLPNRLKFSGFFDLCLHWVSVLRVLIYYKHLEDYFSLDMAAPKLAFDPTY